MRTIRRIYMYLVAVISLQTVLWGVINLLRAMLDTQRVGGSTDQLRSALATIIVGLPIFFLHWWLVQRRIPSDAEERGSGVRAVFLYGLLLGLLIPVAQNLLAILNRTFISLFDLRPMLGVLGVSQTWIDNGIALVMNAVLAGYFMTVLRSDWRAGLAPGEKDAVPSLDNLTLAQRIFRYALVVYSLGLLVYGLQQIMAYLLGQFGQPNINALAPLANGLSLTIFGVLLWWNAWRTVQQSLREDIEQKSTFRLVFLYLGILIGLITLLSLVGDVLFELLRWLLSRARTFEEFFDTVQGPLSAAVPFALLWAYHQSVLKRDQDVVQTTPRREGYHRLYLYLVSFIGLIVSFVALQNLISYMLDALFARPGLGGISAYNSLAGSLAALVIGLPVWLRTWMQLSEQVRAAGESGDRARRSLVRKSYLYLTIFVGVVGSMISAGGLIFELLGLLLGAQYTATALDLLQVLDALLLFIVLLVYHWRVLRADNRLEEQSMTERHSMFPVLVLDQGDEQFATPIVTALRDEAPGVPVAVHFVTAGVPNETLSDAGAVVFPSGMAANPPEAMRIWLNSFAGKRIAVPIEKEGWIWIDADTTSVKKLSKQVAQTVRKLAEGDSLDGGGRISAWVIVAAVFGGLIGLSMLINLLSLLLNF